VHLETEYDVCVLCGSLLECPHDIDMPEALPRGGPPRASLDAENTCEMVANTLISPRTEVLNTYGENLSNAELLVRYGFALDGNENDVITWTADEVWDASGLAGPSGESSWNGLRTAPTEEVLHTWISHPGWADSLLVSNSVSRTHGDHAAGARASPKNSPAPLCLTGDGAISHSLWLLCAFCVLCRRGEHTRVTSTDEVVQLLEHVAGMQVYMEKLSAEQSDEEAGPSTTPITMRQYEHKRDDDHNIEMVTEVIRTVLSLCRRRLDRLAHADLSSSAAVGEFLDTIPAHLGKKRMAVTHAMGEMSLLESCQAGWGELLDMLLSFRSANT